MNFNGSDNDAKRRKDTSQEEAAPNSKEENVKTKGKASNIRPKMGKKKRVHKKGSKEDEDVQQEKPQEDEEKKENTEEEQPPQKDEPKENGEHDEVAVEPIQTKTEDVPFEQNSKTVEKKDSEKNAVAQFVDEEEEKPKELEKKVSLGQLFEQDEKKREKERREKSKRGDINNNNKHSGRTRKKHQKSGRKKNSDRKNQKGDRPKDSPRREKSKMDKSVYENHPPTPLASSKRAPKKSVKNEKETTKRMDVTKKRTTATSSGMRAQTPPASPDETKKKSFFRAIIDKSKFWARKSDCVAQPTKEMLSKSFVVPEYGHSADFKPALDVFMKAGQVSKQTLDDLTEHPNSRGPGTTVFIDHVPFWFSPSERIPVPKVNILAFSANMQAYKEKDKQFVPDKKRETFFCARTDCAPSSTVAEFENAKCDSESQDKITSNTFRSLVEVQKTRKLKTISEDKSSEQKSSVEKKRAITWKLPPTLELHTYDRKNRVYGVNAHLSRHFDSSNYTPGVTKKVKKKKSVVDVPKSSS